MGPQPIQFHDMFYPAFLSALNIDSTLPIEEKVRLLRELPEDVFAEVPPTIPNRPVLDGTFITEIPSFKGLERGEHREGKPEWLESVLFSDCEADVLPKQSHELFCRIPPLPSPFRPFFPSPSPEMRMVSLLLFRFGFSDLTDRDISSASDL